MAETLQEKAKRLEQRDLGDLRVTLSSGSGRRLLFRLLNAAGLYDVPKSIDPNFLAYHAGQRSVGLWLRSEIESADVDLYHELMMEQRHEEHNSHEYRRSDD